MSFLPRFVFCLLVAGSLSGCLLTNELGLRPPGSIVGAELKNEVAETAMIAFSLSVSGYCSRFTSGSATCAGDLRKGKSRGQGIVFLLTPDLTAIEPGTFYTGESADECLGNVFIQMLLLPNLYLQSEDSTTSTGSITLGKPTDAVSQSAVVGAQLAADACSDALAEPGPLLYFGGSSL